MSTSLLYHAFGVRGYRYARMEFGDGRVTFHIIRDHSTCRCSACGSADVVHRGEVSRVFRSQPIGREPTVLALRIPRPGCRRRGIVRQVEVGFADPRRSYTRAFERYVLESGRRITIRDVAKLLGVGWDMVKEIVKRDLSRRFARPKLKHLATIAIDEFAVSKGHRYTTTVLDLDSGAVDFVGDGKAGDALRPFRKRLRPSGAKIKAVAMDMSAAYRKAARENLPGAAVVFDHFHTSKLFNDKLSDLRRDLHRELTDGLQRRVLKGGEAAAPEGPREPRRGEGRGATPGRSPGVKQAAGRGLLHEGGPATILGTTGQDVRDRLPRRLAEAGLGPGSAHIKTERGSRSSPGFHVRCDESGTPNQDYPPIT